MDNENNVMDPLKVIREKRPGFIIRWGLVVFCVIVMALLLVAYFAGYSLLAIVSTTH